MVYRRQIQLLTLYITLTNHTVARAFHTKTDILPINGRFAIGQWMPSKDNVTVLPNSSFNARIDELRIWRRRSNPSVIHRNPKINPSAEFSKDLLHLFKFDNLSRSFVQDELTPIKFYYHVWYPAIPNFSDLDIDYQIEKTRFKNRAFEEDARNKCRRMLFEGEIYAKCKDLGYGVISRFYMECLKEIAKSDNIDASVHTVVSFIDHCKDALEINDDLSWPLCNAKSQDFFSDWSGMTCNRSCIFGVWRENIQWYRNNTNGTEDKCICEHGYWGDNCSQPCPGGALNTCNNGGVCDALNGTCSCQGNRASVNFNQTNKLPCSECLPGWRGTQCNIASNEKSVTVLNIIKGQRICGAFGNMHYTTFEGSSFSIDLQGMYLLVGNGKVQIYVILKACGMTAACRTISEIFIIGRFGQASVAYSDGKITATSRGIVTGNIFESARVVYAEVKPAVYWQSLLRDTTIRYAGEGNSRIEIQAAEYYFITVLLYGDKMSVVVEEQAQTGQVEGICGYVMRNSSNVMLTPGERYLNGTYVDVEHVNKIVISQQMIASELTALYSWNNSTSILLTNASKFWQKGPGYMMQFSHSRLIGNLESINEKLDEWTIEMWIHPGRPTGNASNMCKDARRSEPGVKQQIFSIEHQGNKYLSLWYNGHLTVEWNKYTIATDYNVMSDLWTHVSVSWRSYDGRVRIQSTTECGRTQSSIRYNVNLGGSYSMNGSLVIGQYLRDGRVILENDFNGAIDELRIWRYARSENDTKNQARKRLYLPHDGLLLAAFFDEKNQSKLPVVFVQASPQSENGIDSPVVMLAEKLDLQLQPLGNPPEWLPSTAPVHLDADYAVTFRNSYVARTARQSCQEKFYTGVLNTYCSVNLPLTAAFYYQSCISDIAATEDIQVSSHLEVSFALLCSKKIQIQPCKLRPVYDGFPYCVNPQQQPTWTGTRIFLLVLAIILVLFVIFAVTVWRRRGKKMEISPRNQYEEEHAENADERQLFDRDSFLASSFRSLDMAVEASNGNALAIDSLVKKSDSFLFDDGKATKESQGPTADLYKTHLMSSYEEIETEF